MQQPLHFGVAVVIIAAALQACASSDSTTPSSEATSSLTKVGHNVLTSCPSADSFRSVAGPPFRAQEPLVIDEKAELQCKFQVDQGEAVSLIVYKQSVDSRRFLEQTRKEAGVCLDGSCDSNKYYLEEARLGDESIIHGGAGQFPDGALHIAFQVVRIGERVCASSWVGKLPTTDLSDETRQLLHEVAGTTCGL